MTDLLAQFLSSPIPLSGFGKICLIFPICLSISIVYKATRLERLRDMPLSVLWLWITIVVGMYGVGMALWIVYLILR